MSTKNISRVNLPRNKIIINNLSCNCFPHVVKGKYKGDGSAMTEKRISGEVKNIHVLGLNRASVGLSEIRSLYPAGEEKKHEIWATTPEEALAFRERKQPVAGN